MVQSDAERDEAQCDHLSVDDNFYEEGRLACANGVPLKRCPYKGTKGGVFARIDWLRGYRDKANEEAREARAALGESK